MNARTKVSIVILAKYWKYSRKGSELENMSYDIYKLEINIEGTSDIHN
jgi:hypothetical protein